MIYYFQLLIVVFALFITLSSSIIRYDNFTPPIYEWNDIGINIANNVGIIKTTDFIGNTKATLASSIVNKPVYVSIATISTRIEQIHKTIRDVLEGPIIPDHIYVFISSDPFLIDLGINHHLLGRQRELLELVVTYPVSIIDTPNIGPHRKLLPLLSKKWNEDCIIITLDDDYKSNHQMRDYVSQLIKYYIVSEGNSIIALKSRRIGFCDTLPYKNLPYTQWGNINSNVNEMLLLPTGTGGILYRPNFFHPIVFDLLFRNLTRTADDLTFRLATMMNDIDVLQGCREYPSLMIEFNKKTIGRKCIQDLKKNDSRIRKKLLFNHSHFKDNNRDNDLEQEWIIKYRNEFDLKKQKTSNFEDKKLYIAKMNPAAEDFSDSIIKNNNNKDNNDATKSTVNNRRLQSLYDNFNRRKGNDLAWTNSLKYLKKKFDFDFTSFAKIYIQKERENCFISASNDSLLKTKKYYYRSCSIKVCSDTKKKISLI